MNKKILLKTTEADIKKRLDNYLSEQLDISRSKAQKLIKDEKVLIGGKITKKPAFIIDTVGLKIEPVIEEIKPIDIKPEKIPLNILFENKDVLVISKPAGIVVHPDSKHSSGTLVNAVLGYLGSDNLSNIGDSSRPGVVHRLDKDTSGVIIFAKNDKAHMFLAEQFASRKVEKTYKALTHGAFEYKTGTIDSPISRSQSDRKKMDIATKNKRGKNAITHFDIIETFENTSLAKVNIETGRTHQIRVHFSAIGHPIIGDEKYGNKKLDKALVKKLQSKIPRIFLHSEKLSITLPNEDKPQTFTAELPKDLSNFLEILKEKYSENL